MILDEVKRKVKNRIQPYEKIPNPEQLHEAVIIGIDNLSERSPKLKKTTIQILSDVDTYNLPNDFQSLNSFEYEATESGMSGGLLYPGGASRTSYKIVDNQIIIYPTPSTNRDVAMYYYATYSPDDNMNYGLSNQQANAVVLKACEIITRMKADKAAEQAWIQQNEQERVDMSKKYSAFSNEAEAFAKSYNEAILTINSQSVGTPYGSRKKYNYNPYDPWNGRLLDSDTY